MSLENLIFLPLNDINNQLAQPIGDTIEAPTEFAAILNAHGLYSTTQFVLRLSPRIHDLVDSINAGTAGNHDPNDLFSAYSTYLHETIHWWQHIGSTAGLILSLCYPAQCVANIEHLRKTIQLVGPKKSLKLWAENALRAGTAETDEGLVHGNRAVNNTIDIAFYKAMSVNPSLAERIFQDPYFECLGHSYAIAYANTLHALIDSCDFSPASLPDPEAWNEQLNRLRESEHEGFYHGSPIRRARIGLLDIFEGQARFSQLQFLHAVGGPADCDHYREGGYFEGNYISAFNEFLRLTEFPWPKRIHDPVISLFLLICDLALNPTRGFPFEMARVEDLIFELDPGARFTRFCYGAKQAPKLAQVITSQSFEEYVEVAGELARICEYDDPMMALHAIINLIENDPGAASLMAERESFDYSPANQPIRVIVSHFLSFSRDKFAHPEFFCWPGAYVARAASSPEHRELFERNLSLFSDRSDNERIFPRAVPGKRPDAIQSMLNVFFGSLLMYDLTRQWILDDGPFCYNFRWLTGRSNNDELIEWAKSNFAAIFGAHPDTFEQVSRTSP